MNSRANRSAKRISRKLHSHGEGLLARLFIEGLESRQLLSVNPASVALSPPKFLVSSHPAPAIVGGTRTTGHAGTHLTINLSFDSSVTTDPNAAGFEAGVTYAAQQLENLFTNNVAVNITVVAVPGTSTLGESESFLESFPYASIAAATLSNNPGLSIPANDPVPGNTHNWWVTTAQAKALGLIGASTNSDGTFNFGAGYNYTFDPNNRAVAGKIDFIGVAEHELTELLGRISGLGTTAIDGTPAYLEYDLFRYTNTTPTSLDMADGNNVFFSTDFGATLQKQYNFANGNGSDPQDWASGTNDAFNAFSSAGVKNDITAVDVNVEQSVGLVLAAANTAPTLTNAAATPSTVTGKTTLLTVTGNDDGGEPNLKYTWATTGSVPAAVGFDVNNGTNAGKSETATFSKAGTYNFLVTATDAGNLSTTITTPVTVTVNQTDTSIVVTPAAATPAAGGTTQFSALAYDQFKQVLAVQPAFVWTLVNGHGSMSPSGLYTAPTTGTRGTVKAADGSVSKEALVKVVSAPWLQADIGGPTVAGYAYDSAHVFTVAGAGSDIFGQSDQFHFVYQQLTGDGSVTARVATQSNTNVWAKAGVMVRNSLGASDAFADMFVTPGEGAQMNYRTGAGLSAGHVVIANTLTAPYFVRIVRAGNTFTTSTSPDGIVWTVYGSKKITMGATAYFGMVVCSHNTKTASIATFDHVVLSQATVATPASATPATVSVGSNTLLSVLGADPNGAANLLYTWAVTTAPAGGSATYSGTMNGTNAARNISASFNVAGTYVLTVTITDGLVSSTSQVTVMAV